MTQKTIILDFDGTIADTLSALLEIYNDSASKFNCRKVESKDIERLRAQRPQKFLKEYGVSPLKIPIMALYIKRRLSKHLLGIKIVEGMPELIRELKKDGIRLGILTSNSRPNVENFIEHNNLMDNFDFICSSKNVFRKDKALLRLINKEKINKNDVIYVGDETRDVEACKRAGVKIIAVTWGFNSAEVLKKAQPWQLVDNPKALAQFI